MRRKRRAAAPEMALDPALESRATKLSSEDLLRWIESMISGLNGHASVYRHTYRPEALEEIRLTAQQLYGLTDEMIRRVDDEKRPSMRQL